MGRVLIADDAIFMRKMLRDLVEEAGYEVVAEAANGREAVELYKRHRPNLVTMDVVMPIESGVEATRRILEFDPQARIVMVSAMGQESIILEALEAGALDYIVKPFQKNEVIDVLQRTLEEP